MCEGTAIKESLIKGWVVLAGERAGVGNHASGQKKHHVSSQGSSLCLLRRSVLLSHLAGVREGDS